MEERAMIKPRYYSVKDIKILEHCGKDKAYAIAKSLPHEKRGKVILVFAEDYEKDYELRRKKALEKMNNADSNNIYQFKRIWKGIENEKVKDIRNFNNSYIN